MALLLAGAVGLGGALAIRLLLAVAAGSLVASLWGPSVAMVVVGVALVPWSVGAAVVWGLGLGAVAATGVGARRWGGSGVKAGVWFWALVGGPVSAAYFGWISPAVLPVNWDRAIGVALAGLAGTLLGDGLASLSLPWRLLAVDAPVQPKPLRHYLFRRFGLIAALPLLVVCVVAAQRYARLSQEHAKEGLTRSARQVAMTVDHFLQEHRDVLLVLAGQVNGEPMPEPTEWDRRLAVVQGQFAGFLTMVVADEDGNLVGKALGDLTTVDATEPQNVSDREYFRVPMRTGRPFVSGVFEGRGFGRDLIVAISVPGRDASGRRWVLEGSLSLNELVAELERTEGSARRDIVLTDGAGRVVVATGEVGLAPLSVFGGFEGEAERVLAEERETVRVAEGRRPGEARAEQFWVTEAPVALADWRVFMRERRWFTWRETAGFYLFFAAVAAVLAGLVLAMASLTGRRLTRTLRDLVKGAHEAATGTAVGDTAEDVNRPAEFNLIGRELRTAATSLHASNQALQQLSGELEEKVRERTQELEDARAVAEAANRAKSEFLTTMSHELRTPLHVILGMTEIVRDSPQMARTEVEECLSSVEESGSHLLDLINDILDLSKVEAGKLELDLEWAPLLPICEAALRLVEPQSQRKQQQVELIWETAPDRALELDARRLKQVLVNLLANAVKFTPAQGHVSLRVADASSGDRLLLTVTDDGPGISAEDQQHLFQPFVQVGDRKRSGLGGTGLGLAVVKRMVELHHGSVEVNSVLGEGSAFRIELPLPRNESGIVAEVSRSEQKEAIARLEAQVRERRLRVLVVEDNEMNIAVLRRHLQAVECEIDEARNGKEAITRATVGQPDLILMDVQMPLMDGIDATLHLRSQPETATLPIVFLTASAMGDQRQRCMAAGGTDHLTKPVRRHELLEVMLRVTEVSA
ncbi:ATP-binding protein [Actomonas aquatica]|uniref:histidine kinase n=1 Tax=Actomonas aquatica TaxID=2866162 RepID=A0ABZ1CCW1_9BACT|nr:ATP-binding protein [Opitutus sp. WL0086]WRQ89421.1 ATP-binding protein [Opitutus sp. WL0086]